MREKIRLPASVSHLDGFDGVNAFFSFPIKEVLRPGSGCSNSKHQPRETMLEV